MKKFTLLALIATFAGTAYQLSGVTVLGYPCPSSELLASYRDWVGTMSSHTFANLSNDVATNLSAFVNAFANMAITYGNVSSNGTANSSLCTTAGDGLPSYCCNSPVECTPLYFAYAYQTYMYASWLNSKNVSWQSLGQIAASITNYDSKQTSFATVAQQLNSYLTSPYTTPQRTATSGIKVLDACATAVLGN